MKGAVCPDVSRTPRFRPQQQCDPYRAPARESRRRGAGSGRRRTRAARLPKRRFRLEGFGIRLPADGILCCVRRAVARCAHEIPDRPPIWLEVGERVEVRQHDDEWPAFVFVITGRGSGWVPERHLDRAGSTAVVKAAYDTTELPTREGEELEVIGEDPLSGWMWCRAKNGREGWVPERTLSPLG
jgi:SH3 domain